MFSLMKRSGKTDALSSSLFPTSPKQIRSLHPQIKPIVKSHIQKLKENPYIGKSLERELSAYYSLRMKRFRIIYKIDHQNHIVQIHYVGHRKDIYEVFKKFLTKEELLHLLPFCLFTSPLSYLLLTTLPSISPVIAAG